MARHAAGIALESAEFLVPAGTIEARRLETHRVDMGLDRALPSCLVLDRCDQLRAKPLAALLLVDPEILDEQNRGPEMPDDAADDLAAVLQRDRDALGPLLPELLVIIGTEPGEHSLLGGPNGALDGDGWHGLAKRHVDRRFRQLRVEAALVELGDQGTLELVALVE